MRDYWGIYLKRRSCSFLLVGQRKHKTYIKVGITSRKDMSALNPRLATSVGYCCLFRLDPSGSYPDAMSPDSRRINAAKVG